MKRYIDAYEALFPVMSRANDYYERELYRTDGMAEGRTLHARMMPLVTAFLTEREATLRDIRPFVREVERQEVRAIEAREGRSLAWQAAQIRHAANNIVDLFPRARPVPIDAGRLDKKLDAIGPNTSGEKLNEIIAGAVKPVDVAIDMERFNTAVMEYGEAVLFERFAAKTPEGLKGLKDLPRRFLTSLRTLQESLTRSQGLDSMAPDRRLAVSSSSISRCCQQAVGFRQVGCGSCNNSAARQNASFEVWGKSP